MADFAGHRRAVHARHDHVADHQVEVGIAPHRLDPLVTVRGGHHGVALARQRAFGDRADHVLVLDQQDAPAARPFSLVLDRLGLAQLVLARLVHRQVDRETRALRLAVGAQGVVGEDEPARLLDDAVDGRQPEPGALALLLGGEERLEDLRQVGRRDAAAGVLGDQHRIVAGRDDLAARPAHVAGDHPAGGEGQRARGVFAAARLDRIARVDGEVDDHLLELARVGPHGPEIAVMMGLERDLGAEQPLEQLADLGDHVGQLQHFGLQRLLAAEREQLAGQRGRAVRVGLDLLDVVVVAVAGRVPQQHQVAVADDRGQHVVEVVRHAAGELADRLHLGRLRDLPLEARLLGRVGQAQQHRRLAEPADPREPHRDRLVGLVAQPHGDVAAHRRALPEAPDRVGHRRLVLADDEVRGIGRHLAGDPGSPPEGRVGEQKMAVAVGHRQAERQLLEQALELRRLPAALAGPAPQPDTAVEQHHQRGRLARALRFRGIRVGQRHVDQRLRRPLAALAREVDPVALVRAQQRGEVEPGHAGILVARGAAGEAGARGADRPVGADQRDLDPRGAENPAERPGDPLTDTGERFGADDRREPPDQVVVATSGTLRGAGPRLAPVGHSHLGTLALAPCRARGPGELLGRCRIDREAGRSMARPEPQLVSRVGADQPVGAVGHGDRHARLLDRGDGHRPVRRSAVDVLGRRRAAPCCRVGQEAEHREPPDVGERHRGVADHQLDQRHADQDRRGHRQPVHDPMRTARRCQALHHSAGSGELRRRACRRCHLRPMLARHRNEEAR